MKNTVEKVFILEDSKTLREMMNDTLTGLGYHVESVYSIAEFRQKFKPDKADIILLDLILPDGNGLSALLEIRQHTDVPIIVISDKDGMIDKVVGLEMGADDYVGKPIQMEELTARVKAQIRRYKSLKFQGGNDSGYAKSKVKSPLIRFGSWILNKEKYQVFDENGKSANLTAKEFRLLETLILARGRVLTREQLLEFSRDGNYNTTERAIDVQILRIRKKLGGKMDSSGLIQAVRGVGYTFTAEIKTVD